MRIGLFTDTYRPTVNGITFVVETLKRNLEAEGHEVFIFCPAKTISPTLSKKNLEFDDDNIIRIPSFSSGFFEGFDFTVFFPPKMLRQIDNLNLDVIHIFTPSQIGLLGINAAIKQNTPLVVQHSTDLYEFVEHYPIVLPGVLALIGIVFPMSVKLQGKDIKEIIKLYRPRMGATKWNKCLISRGITMLHSKADAVIALSRKSYRQLDKWQDDIYNYRLILMPSGIDAIPAAEPAEITDFRKQWGFSESDEVFGFVGRLGEEKNLAIMIEAMDQIGQERPNAKLLFVGDFDYREELEKLAANSKFPDRIIFTGIIPREKLDIAYQVLDIFVFPSLKDTQGWVLHEAAHAKKPIVLIDQEVSEVVKDGESGYFAQNNATDLAEKIVTLLKDPQKRKDFGEISKKLAMQHTEKAQTQKLIELYYDIVKNH